MKPNYQFEKRQRELEKKKKKAEKALRKENTPEVTNSSEGEPPSEQGEESPKTD